MFLYIFIGFLIGFFLSLCFVQRPKRALIWGVVLGLGPLVLMLGPANAPIQGIGSILNLAFFALGPLMLIPFVASGVALGVAGAAAVMWGTQGHARWVRWVAGTLLIGICSAVTLVPVVQRELSKRERAAERDARTEAIMRADFTGTLGDHEVRFPASPRLSLGDDCGPIKTAPLGGCRTPLVHPVSILTRHDEVLLHERNDPIRFLSIHISTIEPDCQRGGYCLTPEKVAHWCAETRPDQAEGIWCRDIPPLDFSLRIDEDVRISPSDRDEPELAARFADAALENLQLSCFYAPKPSDPRQGDSCSLSFRVAEGVTAVLFANRDQILSDDPILKATTALIPQYWDALTEKR